MNWVDLVIILLLIGAVYRGIQAGLLHLGLSFAGFIVGLLIGSWLASRLAVNLTDQLLKLFVILGVELVLALGLAGLGEVLAYHLARGAVRLHLGKLNQILGAILAAIFMLGTVWLVSQALIGVSSHNIGENVRSSRIIRLLDSALSSPPDIFAGLEKIIDPNGFPNVFLGLEPQHTTIAPNTSLNNQAILKDEASVVKVEGIGCGGIVDGSGFVVQPGLVVTNAHVVAGIAHPRVIDQNGSYRAVPIWFDPNLDVAVLRVSGLTDQALTLVNRSLPNDDAAAVMGYPGGGPLVAGNAVIIDRLKATGQNIYNQGTVTRSIYEVQANVEPGNSGGPLFGPTGSVAGIVFAKSLSQSNVGYALDISQIKPIINQATDVNQPVNTSSCPND